MSSLNINTLIGPRQLSDQAARVATRSLGELAIPKIRAAMKARGWGQKDLAAATGLSQATVSLLLGKNAVTKAPNIESLALICEALDIDLIALVAEAFPNARSRPAASKGPTPPADDDQRGTRPSRSGEQHLVLAVERLNREQAEMKKRILALEAALKPSDTQRTARR